MEKIHYGWVRLNSRSASYTATVTGYAYETILGKPIIADKTKGPDESGIEEAIPAALNNNTLQPASLGLLAAGSPRLSVWRREESVEGISSMSVIA